ncbi:MAG: ribose-5-phosphate isomerase A [Candidatus Vidania fulgoroideorum]
MIFNKKIIVSVLEDYIENMFLNKISIVTLGKCDICDYFLKKVNISRLGIKRIFSSNYTSNFLNYEKNFLFKDSYNFDLFLGSTDSFFDLFFFNFCNGYILKEKFFYDNSKHRLLICKNKSFIKNGIYIPVEIIPRQSEYIIGSLSNLGFKSFLSFNSNGNLFYNVNNLNILNVFYDFNINPLLFEKILCSIKGVVSVGIFINRNTSFFIFNGNKFKLFYIK